MDPKAHPRVSVFYPEGEVRIPPGVEDLAKFRRWCEDDEFPSRGRIDYLQGELDVDMSPEEACTHGTPKVSIAACLHGLIVAPGHGLVFIDRMRVVSPVAGLSVEPDVVVVLYESIAAGRVRLVESSSRRGKYIELEGAPDLLVEVISDGSVTKDRRRLPDLYARAGVPELWLADARRGSPALEIHELGHTGYVRVKPETASVDAWTSSPLLCRRFRLCRREANVLGIVSFELEVAGDGGDQ